MYSPIANHLHHAYSLELRTQMTHTFLLTSYNTVLDEDEVMAASIAVSRSALLTLGVINAFSASLGIGW